jgi:hypothetical protein
VEDGQDEERPQKGRKSGGIQANKGVEALKG